LTLDYGKQRRVWLSLREGGKREEAFLTAGFLVKERSHGFPFRCFPGAPQGNSQDPSKKR